jgi:hypothetical protein
VDKLWKNASLGCGAANYNIAKVKDDFISVATRIGLVDKSGKNTRASSGFVKANIAKFLRHKRLSTGKTS